MAKPDWGELQQRFLSEHAATRYPLQGITADMVYAVAMAQHFQGQLLSEWADNLESDRLARIVNAVRRGYLAGDTVETIARSVRSHANKDYRDGALQMSRANAASIAKTAVNHLAATARNSFTSANSDIVKGKQWLSVRSLVFLVVVWSPVLMEAATREMGVSTNRKAWFTVVSLCLRRKRPVHWVSATSMHLCVELRGMQTAVMLALLRCMGCREVVPLYI